MQATTTRLGQVLDGLLTTWRAALAPDKWVVIDGPPLGSVLPPLIVSVGVGNEQDGDPYRVVITDRDMTGRHQERGTVRCQMSAVAADARDLAPTRDVVLAALAVIDEGLRGEGITGADRIALGDQQWWHLADDAASVLIVACHFDIEWTAWV